VNILDLDLDFFMSHVLYDNVSALHNSESAAPWRIGDVDCFLRHNCRLWNRIPGWVVNNHKDVFYIVKGDRQHGLLESPHSWVHIDSHSDLGSGSSIPDIAECMNFTTRYEDVVNSNNYLLALICDGCIAQLYNVYNKGSILDYDLSLFSVEQGNQIVSHKVAKQTISFLKYVEADFTWDFGFDLMFLSLSVEYTCKESFAISNHIRANFMKEIQEA
jgi:hypothetical protein